jgi:hypothetical protein
MLCCAHAFRDNGARSKEYPFMSSPGTGNLTRPWKEIASEAYREQDPKRLAKLVEELARAIDDADKKLSEME